jgi:hypothetical protein
LNLSKICLSIRREILYCMYLYIDLPSNSCLESDMENISRGPIFGFLSLSAPRRRCRTLQLHDYRVQENRLPCPPSFKCKCTASESLCGQSKYSMPNTKDKGVVGNLCISLAPAKMALNLNFVFPIRYLDDCPPAPLWRVCQGCLF